MLCHWHLHWLLCPDSVTMSSVLVTSFSNSPSEPPWLHVSEGDCREMQESHTIIYYSGGTWDSTKHLALSVHTKNWNAVIKKIFHLKVLPTKDARYSLTYSPQKETFNLFLNAEPRKLQSKFLPLWANCSFALSNLLGWHWLKNYIGCRCTIL